MESGESETWGMYFQLSLILYYLIFYNKHVLLFTFLIQIINKEKSNRKYLGGTAWWLSYWVCYPCYSIIPPVGNKELLAISIVLAEHCLFSCKKETFTWTGWGKGISEDRKCIWDSQELESWQELPSPIALFSLLLCVYLLNSSLFLFVMGVF